MFISNSNTNFDKPKIILPKFIRDILISGESIDYFTGIKNSEVNTSYHDKPCPKLISKNINEIIEYIGIPAREFTLFMLHNPSYFAVPLLTAIYHLFSQDSYISSETNKNDERDYSPNVAVEDKELNEYTQTNTPEGLIYSKFVSEANKSASLIKNGNFELSIQLTRGVWVINSPFNAYMVLRSNLLKNRSIKIIAYTADYNDVLIKTDRYTLLILGSTNENLSKHISISLASFKHINPQGEFVKTDFYTYLGSFSPSEPLILFSQHYSPYNVERINYIISKINTSRSNISVLDYIIPTERVFDNFSNHGFIQKSIRYESLRSFIFLRKNKPLNTYSYQISIRDMVPMISNNGFGEFIYVI